MHNCLQLLHFAQLHAFPVLAIAALGLLTQRFAEVTQADQKGLTALSQNLLMDLLAACDTPVCPVGNMLFLMNGALGD